MNTFQVKYFNNGKYSHEYTESWEKTELFCPACGKREVHEEQSEGDYYVGTWFLCAACGAGFHLPTHPEPRPMNEQDQQRLAAIRDTSNAAGQTPAAQEKPMNDQDTERVKEIYRTRDRFAHLDRVLRECAASADPIYRTAAALWEAIAGTANDKAEL